jgi:YesN/AraC family two-component response regulator
MAEPSDRILVVDDQPASVALLIAYLKHWDIDLLVAQCAHDGRRIAVEAQPHLILLDVLMPGEDGFSLCRGIKADSRTASIPVIFVSAAMEVEDKLRGFAAGAVDYITKPFSEQELLARVFLQLGHRSQLARLAAEALEERNDVPSSAYTRRRDQRIFTDAVTLLTKRLLDPPSAVDLAHQVGTNQQRLTRVFREQVGMSAYEYLQQLRLERGRSLLQETEMQVQLIADRVGYRNAGDFTRAFRRYFGVTPREYRKGHLEAESQAS